MLTMTDQRCVDYYAKQAYRRVYTNWDTLCSVQRFEEFHRIISEVHKICEVPITTLLIDYTLWEAGIFQSHTWRIITNPNQCPRSNTDILPIVNGRSLNLDFISLAEVLYHEARHCEQFWHITRYIANSYIAHASRSAVYTLNEIPEYLHRLLFIPINITRMAVQKPLSTGDQMFALAQGCYESIMVMSVIIDRRLYKHYV